MNQKKTNLVTLAVILILGYGCHQQKVKTTHPNVLFIAVDDLNDYTGFAGGHPQAFTPNMNKLASNGTVFINHFCVTSECNPSRTAMLTGYHPKSTGLANNFLTRNTDYYDYVNKNNTNKSYVGFKVPAVNKDLMTMPRYFKEVLNYNTVGCGKIFHHHTSDSIRNSFWNTWRTEYPGKQLTFFKKTPGVSGYYNPPNQWLDWGSVDYPKEETFDYNNAQWVVNQIKNQKKGKPFFIAYGLKKPHDPFYAPREFFNLIPENIEAPTIFDNGDADNDWNNLPYKGKIMADKKEDESIDNDYEIIKKAGKIKEVTRAYLATVAYADACIGLVLEAIEESPFAENTIIVLWSDHGWHLGEKMHYHKFTLWDEAMRSPLIIKVPGGKNKKCTALVNSTDLFPTLIDICGGNTSTLLTKGFKKQGNSLKSLLYENDAQWNMPALTSCYKRFPPIRQPISDEFMAHGIRLANWKFIEYYPDPSKPNDTTYQHELYYLLNDKYEYNNLADQKAYCEIQHKLQRLIHKYPGGEDGEKNENQEPTILIDKPLNNTVFKANQSINIFASAYDIDSPTDIQKVELFIDNERVETVASNTINKSITKVKPGSHIIKVVATDKSNSNDEHTITINVKE